MKFLVPNYSYLQNPWLGAYRLQIPVLSVLCPQLNLLNPPLSRTKLLGTPYWVGNSRKFVNLMTNSSYFLLSDWKQRYLLHTQADFEGSTGKSNSIRSVNSHVYSTKILTCKVSLSSEEGSTKFVCKGWIYIIGSYNRIDLKCSRNNAWITSSLRIHVNEIMRNSSWRYMVGQNFLLYSKVLGYAVTAVNRNEQQILHHTDIISHKERQVLLSSPTEDISEIIRYRRAWTQRKSGAWIVIWKYMNSVSKSLLNIILISIL